MLQLYLLYILVGMVSGRPYLLSGSSWANLAWGYKDGGRDDIDGASVVFIDMDGGHDIESLKRDGKIVMCYISVGTLEGFRSFYKRDKEAWEGLTLGTMVSFSDERWLDIRKLDRLIPLMEARFDTAAAAGCDAIEPDNMDCYLSSECVGRMGGVSKKDAMAMSIDYGLVVASLAHNRGMSVVVKNAIELYDSFVDIFDGAVTENCLQYKECDATSIWTSRNKAVFSTDYSPSSPCDYPNGVSGKWCDSGNTNYLCKDSSWTSCGGVVQHPIVFVDDIVLIDDTGLYK